ncbi:hypothetical protein ACEWY4_024016 [Coilia grayii]|uniref:Uncharacterized protein n=1 Tax=Coilia grayii TaxID=363190 RepID=A0ABD1J2S5_9TELE
MEFPKFKFEPSTSELTLKPSVVAQGVALRYRQQQATSPWQVLSAERVSKEARARVVGRGEEPKAQAVLAEHHLQFGQYRGHTFRWLLENDVGYACSIIASHEKERASGDTSQTPLMSNKDALASYARLFPPMVTAIARRRMREGSLNVRGLDSTLVGFGQHAHKTYKSLYEAKDRESRTYVQWLRKAKVSAGSKVHALQAYVLAREAEKAAAPPAQAPPAATGTASMDPAGPSDADLLAAAMEVDSPTTGRPPPSCTGRPPPSCTGRYPPLCPGHGSGSA